MIMSRAGHGYPTRKSSDFESQWRRGAPGSVVPNHVGERDSRRPPMAGMHRSVPKLRGFQQRKPRKRVGGQRCDPHCLQEPWNGSFVMAPAQNDLHATVAESRRPHVESILTSEVSPDPPPTGCFPTGDSATERVEWILTSEVSPDPPPTGCFPTGDSATERVEWILTSEVSPDPPPTGCFPTGDSATERVESI
jgi:hypothetical protein